jgi:hypothetical protein
LLIKLTDALNYKFSASVRFIHKEFSRCAVIRPWNTINISICYLEAFHSVHVFTNYVSNTPTKWKSTLKYMYYLSSFFSYMFRRLLRHLQGGLFSMPKTNVTFRDYIGLQLPYSCWQNHVYYNVEFKKLKSLCKTLQNYCKFFCL